MKFVEEFVEVVIFPDSGDEVLLAEIVVLEVHLIDPHCHLRPEIYMNGRSFVLF